MEIIYSTLLLLIIMVPANGKSYGDELDKLKRRLTELSKKQHLINNKRKISLPPLPKPSKGRPSALIDEIASLVSSLQECTDASWCSDYKQYCSVHTQVKENCPNMCGTCTTNPECVDTHPNCANGVEYGYCKGTEREQDFMRQYCSKSCGFCGATPTANTCSDDQSESYCSQIKNLAYCNYKFYEERLRSYCKKSCNFCQDCGKAALRKKNESISIVGGETSKKGYYPWQVAIYYKEKFICGGTLISERDVLTAAHCFNIEDKTPSNYKIVLGEYNRGHEEGTEQYVVAEKITVHEDYTSALDHHDIAIVKLSENAKFSDYISKLCTPSRDAILPAGSKCFITGWGKMYSSGDSVTLLQQVEVPIAERSVCLKRNSFNNHEVTDRMICAGYNDGSSFASGCHGDSGGPLQCEFDGKWYLYGVVSWGSPLCNGLDRFTVFTRVSSYLRWIETLRTV